jgi:hypothetical protein
MKVEKVPKLTPPYTCVTLLGIAGFLQGADGVHPLDLQGDFSKYNKRWQSCIE